MIAPARVTGVYIGAEPRGLRFRIHEREYLVPKDDLYEDLPEVLMPGDTYTFDVDGWWAREVGIRRERD